MIIVVAVGVYWWRDRRADEIIKKNDAYASTLRQEIVMLNYQLMNEKIKNNSANVAVCGDMSGAPVDAITNNIKTIINSGNLSILPSYMTSNISILDVDSGDLSSYNQASAIEKIAQFTFNNSSYWDYNFNLEQGILGQYRAGEYGKYFSTTALVGKSGDNRILAFSFDCNNKISVILMATNENLIK